MILSSREMQCVPFDSPVLKQDLAGKLLQFINARMLRGDTLIPDHLWVRDGKITSAAKVFYEEQRGADIQIDCQGYVLSPGFIDIQLNGGFGVDFSTISSTDEDYLAGVQEVSKKLLAHGVTSYAPTLITSSSATYQRVLPLLGRRNGDVNGAGILGAHLEGPFISPAKKGCHPGQYVDSFGSQPEQKLKQVYGSFENIALVTLAPELAGSENAIRCLVDSGVVVSLGHSMAGLRDGEKGLAAGATVITHLFNAMQSYHHRDPGLIGLLTSKSAAVQTRTVPVYYGIISDGIHTDDSALSIAYRTCPEGLILVTDAMAALGMADGKHKLGAQIIIVEGLNAVLEGTTTTAGSVASMPLCVRHLVKATECPLEVALIAASSKPAELLSLPSKGSLNVGMDADLVLLSYDVNVLATFIGGRLVYADSDAV